MLDREFNDHPLLRFHEEVQCSHIIRGFPKKDHSGISNRT